MPTIWCVASVPALKPRSLLAAVQLRCQHHIVGDVERADSLRAVRLVGRQRTQIHAPAAEIQRNLAGALRGIDVQAHLARCADLRDRLDILYHADLVVDVHDRHEHRGLGHRVEHLLRRDDAFGIAIEIRHGDAPGFERTSRVEYRVMLDARRDEVLVRGRSSASQAPRIARLLDSVAPDVNTMPPARGVDESGDPLARRLDQPPRARAARMRG